MALATLTNAGRAAFALALSKGALHIAWGSGDPAWDEPDAELPSLVTATALVNEIGRRTPGTVGFVEPDEAGDIAIPVSVGGEGAVQVARYRSVPGPTPFLYMRAHYMYADASNALIREMGLFSNTELVEGLPPGQQYFVPAEIANPGLLVAAQIVIPRINRSPSIRHTTEFVLPI
jgi:hypothetical protein